MLIIWTSADAATIRKVMGPILGRTPVEHTIQPVVLMNIDGVYTGTIPTLNPGDVLLACGTKALEVLIKAGLFPKGRTVTSLRGHERVLGGGSVFVTFDPTITTRDYARFPEIQWDTSLAIRKHNTGTTEPVIGKYRWVESLHEMIEEIDRRYEDTNQPVVIACDTETMGLDEYRPGVRILSISFTLDPGKSDMLYFNEGEKLQRPKRATMPWEDDEAEGYWQELWQQVNWILTSPKVSIRGANWKYDSRWINRHWEIDCTNCKMDTLLLGSMLDENRSNSLKLHAKLFTNMGGYEDAMDRYDMSHLELCPQQELGPYMGGDTDATYQVSEVFKAELLKDRQLATFYTKLLHPSSKVFEKLERTGMVVDVPYYEQLSEEIAVEQTRLQMEMKKLVPRKLYIKFLEDFENEDKSPFTKPKVMRELFFTGAGFNLKPTVFTEKAGDPSTAQDHLLSLVGDSPEAKAFIDLMGELASANKTQSTYVKGFMKHLRSDGRFHPHYLLFRGGYGNEDDASGADTGRTSCRDPAAQCLRGDSLVLTDKGLIAINCIVDRVEAGEEFKALTHIGQWRRIVGVYRNGVKPVFSVASERATLVSTANHPYLTSRGWVRTDKLQPGDICYELRTPHPALHEPDLLLVDGHEESLLKSHQQGLDEVRGPGDNRVRTVEDLRLLSGGHGGKTQGGNVNREVGGQRELRAGELHLVHSQEASQQPDQHQVAHAQRPDQDGSTVGDRRRDNSWTPALSALDWDSHGAGLEENYPADPYRFREVRIEAITPAGEAETFDLTIESSHSFVANGLVVHNTIPKHTKWTKKLRRAFTCPVGKTILQLDFSQGELRIAACLADEQTMIAAYQAGQDLHSITAAKLTGYTMDDFMLLPDDVRDELRSNGKAGNFGLLYGMGPEGFVEYAKASYGVEMTIDAARQNKADFFELYSGLAPWHERYKNMARMHGQIRSPLGRIRHLPLITSKDRQAASKAERNAINSPVQATLSDMMQLAMVHIDREYGAAGVVEMFMMTHDSVAAFVPIEDVRVWAKRLKDIMENLPLKRLFGWDHQLKFVADAECCIADEEGVLSLAYLQKLKGL